MARTLLETGKNEKEGNTANAKVLAEWFSKMHSDMRDAWTVSTQEAIRLLFAEST